MRIAAQPRPTQVTRSRTWTHREPAVDRDREAHVVAAGAWLRLVGVLEILLAIPMALAHLRAFAIVFAILGVVSMLAGNRLTRLGPWSHVPAALLAVLQTSLALIMLLTGNAKLQTLVQGGWSLAVCCLLLGAGSASLYSPRRQELAAKDPLPSSRWARSPFFWAPAIATLALILLRLR